MPPGSAQDPTTFNTLIAERRQLLNLGYHMLGSVQDAEDVVQETYVRWYTLSEEGQLGIDAPLAWLTKVATRICLARLGAYPLRELHR
ncbi:sigma factor [Streptomyces aureus]|uniref:Sigma factor n=1 Tax=Streptomyces aureus TaxID=193461 RepID=A0ABV4SWK4_9ACTN